jgi:uridylate kinase
MSSAQVVTASKIRRLLLPGLSSIQLNYAYYENEYKLIYKLIPSIKAVEVDQEMETLNAAGIVYEGGSMPAGTMGQAFTTETEIDTWGVYFTITANAIADNLYPEQFPKGVASAHENLRILDEYNAMALFDNAFSNANPQFTLGDGQAMCSFTHPLAQGVNSNMINPAQLNESSTEDLVNVIQSELSYSGLPVKIIPKKYLVGINNQFNVQILTGSQFRPFDTTNSVNPLTYGRYMDGGFIVSHYMAIKSNWFILTDFKDGLVKYEREPLQTTLSVDQANRNIGIYTMFRNAYRCLNYRSVGGSQGY